MNEQPLAWRAFLDGLPPPVDGARIDPEWQAAVQRITDRIIVLDDDPTGVQTVHGIPVYTSREPEDLRRAVRDEARVVYILTNSRALTAEDTARLHGRLARDLACAAREEGREPLLVSRSDSTLRGHYPLETETLYRGFARDTIDGEIIIPASWREAG